MLSHEEAIRFVRKVVAGELFNGTSCWAWVGSKMRGYGQFRLNGRTQRSHRVAWEAKYGPIPAERQIDHLCRNRSCVNPAHMELVTSKINTLRGESFAAKNAVKTHCIHGHPFTSRNTYIAANGSRQCRKCGCAKRIRYENRKKAAKGVI